MFSKVLDCPECKHRFSYEHEGNSFPETISCPECKCSRPANDYSALVLCQSCNTKLQIPLEIIHDDDLVCPKCGVGLKIDNSLLDKDVEDINTYVDNDESKQSCKSLLKEGDIFDKYRILRLLGKGGMAEVYLAEHVLLKQRYAIKLMRNNMNTDDPVTVKRFLREAKLTHKLDHPNIVKVHDVGSDFKTGYLFIAMEYVEGKTLQEMAKDHQLTEEELRHVLVSMGEALKALADARVVHRDIKPSNIMFNADNVCKLMDLGIAKAESNHQAGEMTLTMEQSTIGTPNYASPEQCKSSHTVDIRSDIYSLGTTIYHAASGKLPFDGNTIVETIINVLNKEPEPLKKYRPDLSGAFLELVDDMMRKNPDERPADPETILAALNTGGRSATDKLFRKSKRGAKSIIRCFMPSAYNSRKQYFLRLAMVLGGIVLVGLLVANLQFSGKGTEKATSAVKTPTVNQTAKPPQKPVNKQTANPSQENVNKQTAKKSAVAAGLPKAPADTANWQQAPFDGTWFVEYDKALKAAAEQGKMLVAVLAADIYSEKITEWYRSYLRQIFTQMPTGFEREDVIWLYVGSEEDTQISEVQKKYNRQLKNYLLDGFQAQRTRGVLISFYPNGQQVSEPLVMAIDIARLRDKLRLDYRIFKENYKKISGKTVFLASPEVVNKNKLFTNYDEVLKAAKTVDMPILVFAATNSSNSERAAKMLNGICKTERLLRLYISHLTGENARFAKQFGIENIKRPVMLLIDKNENLITSCPTIEFAVTKEHIIKTLEQYKNAGK